MARIILPGFVMSSKARGLEFTIEGPNSIGIKGIMPVVNHLYFAVIYENINDLWGLPWMVRLPDQPYPEANPQTPPSQDDQS